LIGEAVPRRVDSRRWSDFLTIALLAAVLLAACGDDAAETTTTTAAPTTTATVGGELTVFAAASLTDAFESLAAAFEAAHPGVTVTLSFAASSALREQIVAGAPADVFASASTGDMDQLAEAGALAGEAQVFARNRMTIAVPAGNPAGITGLQDFANPDLLIGLCAAEVPCGKYGAQALESAALNPSVDTYEPDVRSLLTKIEAGELDAGIVYVTDVASAGDAVEAIAIPDANAVQATYPIAVLADAPHPETAAEFTAFVLSAAGREILARFGFLAP
jgi:molybdate transport system substrate-binding protein